MYLVPWRRDRRPVAACRCPRSLDRVKHVGWKLAKSEIFYCGYSPTRRSEHVDCLYSDETRECCDTFREHVGSSNKVPASYVYSAAVLLFNINSSVCSVYFRVLQDAGRPSHVVSTWYWYEGDAPNYVSCQQGHIQGFVYLRPHRPRKPP